MLTLAQVAEATLGRLVGDPSRVVTSVSTDSRTASGGALFVALAGDRFDGHTFVPLALEAGASALLVSDESALRPGASAVVVGDTLVGLQALAAWHRRRHDAVVAALTGSAGKTTTKEIAATILAARFRTLATTGNLNNHIGVPLTLLGLDEGHERAVVEMGCNGFGEIALLARLASPIEAALVTNVGEAHLEGLGSLEGVARAKGELFAALEPSATSVVNLDDPRVRAMPTRAKRLGYGRAEDAVVRLVDARHAEDGRQRLVLDLAGERVEASLAHLGEHNAENAVAAAALAFAVGATVADVVAGIEASVPYRGRLRLLAGRDGLRVIDDTYNSNPRSAAAALRVLRSVAGPGGRCHALLGPMLELGAASDGAHEGLGRLAAELDVTTLVTVGEAAGPCGRGARAGGLPADRIVEAPDPEAAAAAALDRARPGDVVLVKGSRGARLELALPALVAGEEA